MTSREELIAYAQTLVGTPFRHHGRLPGLALDCAGTIVVIADKFKFDYQDQSGYGRNPSNGLLENALDTQPCLERVYDMQAGDVLLMQFGGEPRHVALYTGENVIHAYESVGQVCEHRFSSSWRTKVTAIYRFREVL